MEDIRSYKVNNIEVMLASLNDSMSLLASLGGLEDFKASGKGIGG